MRLRTLLAVALAAVSLAAAPAAAASAAGPSFVPWNWCGSHATTDALRLRTAPSTGTVIGLLDRADRVRTDARTVDARTGAWVHVTLWGRSDRGLPNRTSGWVAARYLAPRPCSTFE